MSAFMSMPLTNQLVDDFTIVSNVDRGLYNVIEGAIHNGHELRYYKENRALESFDSELTDCELVDGITGAQLRGLIGAGTNVNARFKFEQTALMYACEGSLTAAKVLVELGADVNAIGNFGSNALFTAIGNNQNKIVELLIQNGADIHSESTSTLNDGRFNSSPLVYAVGVSNLPAVKLLLDNGANPNTKDINGHTPLGNAIRLKASEISNLLIERGATLAEPTENA